MKKVLEALVEMQTKVSIETVLLILVIAFLVALIIYFTYKNTYSGVMYNPRFNVSLVMITMVTTIVMVVIGSNISVSLGMVGALSIIRFRTAVKDPRDTSFIFWAVVSGLACGTQNYTIVLIGSMFICLILFLFKKMALKDGKQVLIIKGSNVNLAELDKYISKKIPESKCKAKYVSKNDFEVIYDVKFKKDTNSSTIISELQKSDGIEKINIVESSQDTMG